MKVALCFWGISRSTEFTIESIENCIWKPLVNAGIEYKTFVHTMTLDEPYTNPRAEEWNVQLNNDTWKLLFPDKYHVERQEDVDKKLDLKSYRKHGDPWGHERGSNRIPFNTLNNCIRMLYSLEKVTELWSINANEFDAVLYLRPDVRFLTPLNTDWLMNIKPRNILIPNFHHTDGWNDRFALGTPNAMLLYGTRYKTALAYSRNFPLHSEKFLSYSMKQHNISPIPIPFKFRRIRFGGSLCIRDVNI